MEWEKGWKEGRRSRKGEGKEKERRNTSELPPDDGITIPEELKKSDERFEALLVARLGNTPLWRVRPVTVGSNLEFKYNQSVG
jgi:hypothetical protein